MVLKQHCSCTKQHNYHLTIIFFVPRNMPSVEVLVEEWNLFFSQHCGQLHEAYSARWVLLPASTTKSLLGPQDSKKAELSKLMHKLTVPVSMLMVGLSYSL